MIATSLAQAGGPNSIENFARSWQRAVGFHEIMRSRATSIVDADQTEPELRRLLDGESGSIPDGSSPYGRGRLESILQRVSTHEQDSEGPWYNSRGICTICVD